MRRSRFGVTSKLVPIVAIVAILGAPRAAHAQLSVGGYVGAEFDNQNNWLLYGAEARLPLQASFGQPYDANVRLTYHSYGGDVSSTQLDLNALYDWKLATPGMFAPYIGLGAAVLRFSDPGGDENKVGLNIISGTKLILDPTSRINPFLNLQYTIIREFPNSYTLTAGLSFSFGSATAKR